MRLPILACAAAIALSSPASAQNMTGGMVTNPPAPVSNGKATLTATYRNLGPGYAYNVNYDVLVPIQPQTWPPGSGGFNAMLQSTVGTDTNGNDVFWGFDTDTMCNNYLLELQQPNTSGNLPMLPNPFPAGGSGSFSWQMPIIPMEGISVGRVVITDPPSLRNSYSVNSAQWNTYTWLTMYAGLYNLVSTGALCDEGGTGCANLDACIGNRLWDTEPFEARLQIGRGNSGDPYLGCGTGLVGFTAGNIAVMRRGTCNFTEKLENAQNAGAAGAILVNDGRCSDIPDSDPDECVITMGGDSGDGYLIDIPSVLMSRRQGEALIAAINSGQTVRAKMGAVPAEHVDVFSWIFSDADPDLTNDYLVTRVPINLGGGSCTYSLAPTSANYGASGGNGSFSVTTQAGCTWTATPNNGWIHITAGASGTGSGTVSYSVDSNSSSSSRTGTITAAGRTFTITQSGSGGGGSCIDDLQHGAVCLLNNRFEFYMTWTGFDGVTQPVLFTRQSDQTAAGVFQNNPADITVVVKVTNGCSFNDHYWVWLGGFTNAAWRLEVTDTQTGSSHVYTKQLSSTPPQTVKDETTFPCP